MHAVSRSVAFVIISLVLAVFPVTSTAQSDVSVNELNQSLTTNALASRDRCPTPWHASYVSVGSCRTHVGFNFGMDLGLSTRGNRPYWALEVSYRWLYAQYVIGAGGGLGFAPMLDFAGRVEWQVLRLGFSYLQGEPLSQYDVRRDWDLVVGSALSVRLSERCLIGVGVVWYAPNPFDVNRWTEREKARLYEEAIVDAANDLGEAMNGDASATKRLLEGSNFTMPSSADLYRRVYVGVWRQPYLTAGFRVTF